MSPSAIRRIKLGRDRAHPSTDKPKSEHRVEDWVVRGAVALAVASGVATVAAAGSSVIGPAVSDALHSHEHQQVAEMVQAATPAPPDAALMSADHIDDSTFTIPPDRQPPGSRMVLFENGNAAAAAVYTFGQDGTPTLTAVCPLPASDVVTRETKTGPVTRPMTMLVGKSTVVVPQTTTETYTDVTHPLAAAAASTDASSVSCNPDTHKVTVSFRPGTSAGDSQVFGR